MKKQFFKTAIPLLLLAFVILFIGSGCGGDEPNHKWYLDNDGDGFGVFEENPPESPLSSPIDGRVTSSHLGDCNDNDDTIHPDATEIPDNDVDEDCNSLYAYTFYVDDDGDGFGGSQVAILEIAFGTEDEVDSKFVRNNADCDDNNAAINPLADEIMGNGIDDNCDGITDEGVRYLDIDGDGYGSQEESAADGVFNNLDCDDDNPDVHPYAVEVPDNGIDDDCDDMVDEHWYE